MDTRSPISKVPVDQIILKRTEIQKMKHRYQDVRGEIGGHGFENNKQKLQILITERSDITPLLGKDWMKKFNLTILKQRSEDNNQSDKRQCVEKTPLK